MTSKLQKNFSTVAMFYLLDYDIDGTNQCGRKYAVNIDLFIFKGIRFSVDGAKVLIELFIVYLIDQVRENGE